MISLKNGSVVDVRYTGNESGIDLVLFEKCLISAAERLQRGEVDTMNRGLLSEPEIDLAIPGLDNKFSKSGKPRTRSANLSNSIYYFEWNVTAPCPCCGTKVSRQCGYPEFKKIAAEVDATKESIESLAEKCEYHQVFGFVTGGYAEKSAFVYVHKNRGRVEAVEPYCQPCLDKAKILVDQSHALQIQEMNEKEKVQTERLAEERRLEEERIARQKELRLKWEEENPKYLVVEGELGCIDKHNKAVNERLDRGYTIWGHPVNHGGRIAQTLIRKDFLEERSKSNAKNKRDSSRGGRIKRESDEEINEYGLRPMVYGGRDSSVDEGGAEKQIDPWDL